MFNMTFRVLHTAETRQKLEIAVSQAASVAQTYNCLLTRLDFHLVETCTIFTVTAIHIGITAFCMPVYQLSLIHI